MNISKKKCDYMRLKAKKLGISARGHNVCLMNSDEAKGLNIKNSDRVFIKKGSKNVFAVVDVTNTHHFLKQGEIGLFDEVSNILSLKHGAIVDVDVAEKPFSLELVKKKLAGIDLSDSDMYSLVHDIMFSGLSEVEIAHFISGCYSIGLSNSEIISLINSFVNTGSILKFDKYPLINLQIEGSYSHSLMFAVASVISSLKIGFLGLIDRNSDIPGSSYSIFDSFGMKVSSIQENDVFLKRLSCSFLDFESAGVVPVVSKIERLEHPISAFSDGIKTASILSFGKAISASINVICLFFGVGRSIPDIRKARFLKKLIERTSRKLKLKSLVILIDGNYPVERSSGPLLEAHDILMALQCEDSCEAFTDLIADVSGKIIDSVQKGNGKKLALEIINSGQAFDQLKKIVNLHHGKFVFDELQKVPTKYELRSKKNGFVSYIDILKLNSCAVICGAPFDKYSGVHFHKSKHDRIIAGDKLLTLYSSNKKALEIAKVKPSQAVMVGDNPHRDIMPANQLGMKTVWLRRGKRYYFPCVGKEVPNYKIKNFLELMDIF